MRRHAIFALALLIAVSCSHAISYSVSLSKNQSQAYDSVMIDYVISLDERQEISYSLTLVGAQYNETFKQDSIVAQDIDNSHIFFTSNIPAGEYRVYLSFSTETGSGSTRKDLSISPTPRIGLSRKYASAIAFNNITKAYIVVSNTGNVPLDVSRQFSASGYFDISPDSFYLDRGSDKTVNISFERLSSDRKVNITFVGSYLGEDVHETLVLDIIVPRLNITFSNDIFEDQGTWMRTNVSNLGNLAQNLSFEVVYFSWGGVGSLEFYEEIGANQSQAFLRKLEIGDARIMSVSITYLDSDGVFKNKEFKYGVLGSIMPSWMLNLFSRVMGNPVARGILLSAVVALLGFVAFKIGKHFIAKRRARKKHSY